MQFTEVLAALRSERDTLTARVADLEAAIGVIEKLADGPAVSAPPAAAVHGRRSPSMNTIDDKIARILAALRKDGKPMTPADLQHETGLSWYLVTKVVEQLRAKHLVVVTGTTSAKRIALSGTAAKEVP